MVIGVRIELCPKRKKSRAAPAAETTLTIRGATLQAVGVQPTDTSPPMQAAEPERGDGSRSATPPRLVDADAASSISSDEGILPEARKRLAYSVQRMSVSSSVPSLQSLATPLIQRVHSAGLNIAQRVTPNSGLPHVLSGRSIAGESGTPQRTPRTPPMYTHAESDESVTP